MFKSTKTYGHDRGLSVCFRQHRATHSHCSKLHGYAIAVTLVFAAHELDERNWVMDFGALGPVKDFLAMTFDHKLVLAEDDPLVSSNSGNIYALTDLLTGAADIVILPAVGCEAFAQYICQWVSGWLTTIQDDGRVWIESVEVAEHGANSAIYTNEVK